MSCWGFVLVSGFPVSSRYKIVRTGDDVAEASSSLTFTGCNQCYCFVQRKVLTQPWLGAILRLQADGDIRLKV